MPSGAGGCFRVRRWLLTIFASLAVIGLGGLAWSASARADGDPASDVLAEQPLFLPQDGGLTAGQQAELGALVAASQRSGLSLRVALIAIPTDLGSVTELWRQPANYARFLGQELSLVFRGTLLVVMPDGVGLYGAEAGRPAVRAALPAPASGGATPGPVFGRYAISSIRALAAAAGHPLPAVSAGSRDSPGGPDPAAIAVLAAGGLLILTAWAASFRARPWGSAAAQR
jgi:hypothetical protein